MKKYTILFVSILIIGQISAQTGIPIVISDIQSSLPKQVPAGKIWELTSGTVTIVELNHFDPYSMCGAAFQSNPRTLFQLATGNFSHFDSLYEFNFNLLSKVPYTNDNTYNIEILDDLYFYPGTKVSAGSCIKNITLYEYNMTQTELKRIKDNIELKNKEKKRKQQSFLQQQIEKEKAELINCKTKIYKDTEVDVEPTFQFNNDSFPSWIDSLKEGTVIIGFIIDTSGKVIGCTHKFNLNEVNRTMHFQPAQVKIADSFYKVKSKRSLCFDTRKGTDFIGSFLYKKSDNKSKIVNIIHGYKGFQEYKKTDYVKSIDSFMLVTKCPNEIYEVSVYKISLMCLISLQTVHGGNGYYTTNCLEAKGYKFFKFYYGYGATKKVN